MLNLPDTGHSWTENWLFKLANDNATFLYLSLSDVTYSSNFYEGAIINKPSIRESINLSNSTAKTGNISIQIADYNYNGSPISEELFGGSNHYINQTVTVHSKINAETPIQIGTFRLTDISSDGDKISLSLASHRPWDFISVPNVMPHNAYIPTVYGNFIPTSFTGSNYVLPDSKAMYPVPVSSGFFIGGLVSSEASLIYYYIMGLTEDTSQAYVYYYDKSADIFVPAGGFGNNTWFTETIDSQTVYYNVAKGITCERIFKTRPLFGEQIDGDTYGTPANAIDDDGNDPSVSNTLTIDVDDIDSSSTDDERMQVYKFDLSKLDGDFRPTYDGMALDIWYDLDINFKEDNAATTSVNLYYKLTDGTEGTSASWTLLETLSSGSGSGLVSSLNRKNGVASSSSPSPIDLSEGKDKFLYIRTVFYNNSPFEFDGIATIKDIQISYDMYNDKEDKPEEYLYSSVNGLAKDGWESSGAISEIHDAHRDMLIRYTGLTTTEPTGWTALNTARSGWNIRWWALEPEELEKTLNKIAYEGCFIFRFKADGSPQYIFVPDSPTADKTLTKNDIKDFQVKPSNFSNLLTKMDISYEKHPAENRYLTSVSSVNSTARTNWAVETKENIKQVKLDAYVAPAIPTSPSANPNDDFYTYYNNIFGDIKLIVSGTIVNPEFYNLEVGDIVDFSDMHPTKAYGEAWTGKNFMITSIGRTIGTLKFEGREI